MSVRPPVIPTAPEEYDQSTFDQILSSIRDYMVRANAPYPHNASTLNINIGTLPTESALATLRSGDVYRDTTASNVLKVKP